jgi:class 3 adenylate cyclase
VRWSNTSAEKTAGASAGVSTSAFTSVLKEGELRGDAMGVADGPVRIICDRSEFGRVNGGPRKCCAAIVSPEGKKEDVKVVASRPTGTLTFLFTDIEGSSRLWEDNPPAMQAALARHDELLRRAIEEHGGYVFKTVGDAFCAVFPTAPEALEAALEAQRTLLSDEGGKTGHLRVRMALHIGAAEERGGDYFGPPVNRVARLLSAAHGGQVLLSLATQELVRDQLAGGTSLRDLGEHRLKDLFRPERVFQRAYSPSPVRAGLARRGSPCRQQRTFWTTSPTVLSSHRSPP